MRMCQHSVSKTMSLTGLQWIRATILLRAVLVLVLDSQGAITGLEAGGGYKNAACSTVHPSCSPGSFDHLYPASTFHCGTGSNQLEVHWDDCLGKREALSAS